MVAAAIGLFISVYVVFRGFGIADPEFLIGCKNPVFDFGTASQDKPSQVQHTFRLENRTGEVARIDKVVTNCGCMVVGPPPAQIEPGGGVDIPVTVNAFGSPGPFAKQAVVVFKGPGETRVPLTIRGVIAPSGMMVAIPAMIDFGTVEATAVRQCAGFGSSGMTVHRLRSSQSSVMTRASNSPIRSFQTLAGHLPK